LVSCQKKNLATLVSSCERTNEFDSSGIDEVSVLLPDVLRRPVDELGNVIDPDHAATFAHLGSRLWSQFSAIFDNFLRKNWRFSQKPML
jgi:hypothetical protein